MIDRDTRLHVACAGAETRSASNKDIAVEFVRDSTEQDGRNSLQMVGEHVGRLSIFTFQSRLTDYNKTSLEEG